MKILVFDSQAAAATTATFPITMSKDFEAFLFLCLRFRLTTDANIATRCVEVSTFAAGEQNLAAIVSTSDQAASLIRQYQVGRLRSNVIQNVQTSIGVPFWTPPEIKDVTLRMALTNGQAADSFTFVRFWVAYGSINELAALL